MTENGAFFSDRPADPGILRADVRRTEDFRDGGLRPEFLKDFLGQDALKENLSVFIAAARARQDSLDHLFLIGPPGLGKTTIAQITAHELGADFKVTSAPALEKPKDLAGILSTLTERTVFFIDEIHRLRPAIEEMLYIAMEDFELDWVIGQGPAARTVRIPLPKFTLVGATTRAGMVSSPLISRFGIVQRFNFYDRGALTRILLRSASILSVRLDPDAAQKLAECSRGTPRVANRLLRRMRDFSQIAGSGRITLEIVTEGLQRGHGAFALGVVEAPRTHLVARRIGQGTGNEQRAASIQRQGVAFILQQHRTLLGSLLGCLQRLFLIIRMVLLRGIRVVEQPEAELQPQDVAHRLVHDRLAHPAFLHQFFQMAGVGITRHVHVHGGVGGLAGCILQVGAEAVGHHLLDGSPVGHQQAIVVPLIPQHIDVQELAAR